MIFETKKSYITSLVSKGMTFDNACKTVYADEKEIEILKNDNEYIATLEEIHNQLIIERLDAYNNKVALSDKPDDALKQLAYLTPEVFDKEMGNGGIADSQVKPFIINIGEGKVVEVKK